jgi:hypothetical protein
MQAVTIGLDIAKSVFQAHGVDEAGEVVFRRRLTRSRLLEFFQKQATPDMASPTASVGGPRQSARLWRVTKRATKPNAKY